MRYLATMVLAVMVAFSSSCTIVTGFNDYSFGDAEGPWTATARPTSSASAPTDAGLEH